MAIPPYYKLNRPLLELQADGKSCTLNEAAAALARTLALTESDLAETVKNGRSRLKDRLSWAQYDLTSSSFHQ